MNLEEGELPEAYGTGHLLLTARDPHWLYAHWDLTNQQQRRYNTLSADSHLVVRLYLDQVADQPVAEVQVHPESRHWFIHVQQAGVRYVAELGYYQHQRQWISITTSAPVLTPPETVAEDKTVRWATIAAPAPVSTPPAAEPLRPPTPQPPAPTEPVAEPYLAPPPPVQWLATRDFAVPEAQGGRFQGEFPAETPAERPSAPLPPPAEWTPAQERALAEEVAMALAGERGMGSAEIAELLRRRVQPELPGGVLQRGLAAPTGMPLAIPSPVVGEQLISSPAGGEQAQARGFWFNLNAELILYGATEPGARLVIGERAFQLRPDGTFSCRFSLPDGQHELALTATSAHGDSRRAELKFSRRTEYRGEVGTHPQDQALKPPAPENVSDGNGTK